MVNMVDFFYNLEGKLEPLPPPPPTPFPNTLTNNVCFARLGNNKMVTSIVNPVSIRDRFNPKQAGLFQIGMAEGGQILPPPPPPL